MKILCIADMESKYYWDYYDKSKLRDIDLILSSGDLDPDYLQFLVTMSKARLLYVHGNHDSVYDRRPPLGCECIDDRVYDFHGLRILGLGGSMRYAPEGYMYEENEMKRRILKIKKNIILKNGFDILLTHAPARGYGDMDDIPHMGFNCFNSLMEEYKPKYMIHGHVHREYGDFKREILHSSGCKIINAYERHIFDIGEDEFPDEGKTGSLIYDLYKNISLTRRKKNHYQGEK